MKLTGLTHLSTPFGGETTNPSPGYTLADFCDAVWTATTRHLHNGSGSAPPGPLGDLCTLIWTYPTRTLTTAPAEPAAGFFEALVAWFAADPACAAACPGGLVNSEAAPDQPMPYARLWERENAEPVSPDDQEVEAAFSFYAADDNLGNCGDAPARAAGTAVTTRLLAGSGRDAWAFLEHGETWREAGCLWVPPGTVAVAGKARDGRRVWRYDAWFKFFLVRED